MWSIAPAPRDPLSRSRKLVEVDLKSANGIAQLRDLVREADGLIEGFRPGVMERLGIGQEVLLADSPKLVMGRMTGWGQTGPYAMAASHDINYIAPSGSLHICGRVGEKPTPPVNLIGDFGGGGMLLAFGMVAALLNVRSGGQGQVIDCAMTEGAALLASLMWGFHGIGAWQEERGVNLLDTGAHFYDTYETADGKYVAIGSVEPQFCAELRRLVGIDADPAFDEQMSPASWPALKDRMADVFRTRTRDEWCALMEHTDACFALVLSLSEAPLHPHNQARGGFIEVGGLMQPAPAPRFAGTPANQPCLPTRLEPQ